MTEFYQLRILEEISDSRDALREIKGWYFSWSEPLRQVFWLKWKFAHCSETISYFDSSLLGSQLRDKLGKAITAARSKIASKERGMNFLEIESSESSNYDHL